MSISTFHKLTILSCVVLCVALMLPKMLLSRGKRDATQHEGHFPPMPHKAAVSEEQRHSGRQTSSAHNPEAIARAKGAGTGASTGRKSNLAGQIIPIYGFAILLYILYILFKITSKGKTTNPPESRFIAVRSEKRKITDFELAQLQDRLNETKDVIQRNISAASVSSDSMAGSVAVDEEQKLLYQLQEITRVMHEGQLMDTVSPYTEEHHCQHECADFPADSQNDDVNEQFCCVHSSHTFTSNTNDEHQTDVNELSADTEDIHESHEIQCVEEHEEDDGDYEEKIDANRNRHIEDISVLESMSQSQHTTQTGSDITPISVSDNSVIRRWSKK
ncbi:protein RIC-3b isoform X1 [Myxocyprinus asiaticus]|uniref:protein RIC-3b isoform X1 n=2 Tax=Myxocyprinus asiaticus TaxID=70543 RepID=UPI0022233013|nr:protein RIC-3b isoform X1 [Myxocyprinus asiaticus]